MQSALVHQRVVAPTRAARSGRESVKVTATTVPRNANVAKLQGGYLFPEIARRKNEHIEKNPDAHVISLGIGDTTEPIPAVITDAMAAFANGLNTKEGYSGYGNGAGNDPLRAAIAETQYSNVDIDASEVFVCDGSKCDIGRLQMLFGNNVKVAVQDPSYPVYVDSSVIMGMTGTHNGVGFDNIQYMLCNAENNFFPNFDELDTSNDIVFICSPNNPTGAAATREQLTVAVNWAKENGAIIVFDAAYALYIEDENCPKTIYEIPGADEVAIETCSLSKYAGFTGVRCGWTTVPKKLQYADGHQVHADFSRVMNTVFNGASNVVQAGALACFSEEGKDAMAETVAFYKENARILHKTFTDMGFTVYGGVNAPYVWVGFPGRDSWDVFAEILEKCNIVTTPGSGFGPGGQGFVRASAFGSRENILEAVKRFQGAYGDSNN